MSDLTRILAARDAILIALVVADAPTASVKGLVDVAQEIANVACTSWGLAVASGHCPRCGRDLGRPPPLRMPDDTTAIRGVG